MRVFRLKDLENQLQKDDVFKKDDEKAVLKFVSFSTKYPKVQVKRELPSEPLQDTTIEILEEEFYVIRSGDLEGFCQHESNTDNFYVVDSAGHSASIKKLWLSRISSASLV